MQDQASGDVKTSFDQAELQSLGDAVISASEKVDNNTKADVAYPALKALAQACLANNWEERKYMNRLKERLSIRD